MIHLPSTGFPKRAGLAILLTALTVGCGRGKSSSGNAPPRANAPGGAREPAAAEKHDDASVIRLSEVARQRASISVVTVQPRSASDVLSAPAELQLNGDRVAMVGPRVVGRVARIAVSMGDRVAVGTVLATIDSPDVGSLLASFTSAQAAESVAQRTYQREKDLFARRISAEREVLAAEAELARATSERRSVESRLQALGVALPPDGSASPASAALLPIRSPIPGTVIERTATIGATVGPDTVLFKLADLSTLWLVAKVPETTMRDIRRGDTVTVKVDALPDQPVSGRVSYIGATVSDTTRTVDVRIDVPNRTGELKPGMFARAQFATRSTRQRSAQILIPQIAVQELNRKRVVFVPRTDGGFDVREVTIGASVGDDLEILSGLKAGDTVVTTGSFTLKSQAVRGEAGESH
jgi:cobalt-zinc-cadmium efflux system membrane fusion protein